MTIAADSPPPPLSPTELHLESYDMVNYDTVQSLQKQAYGESHCFEKNQFFFLFFFRNKACPAAFSSCMTHFFFFSLISDHQRES